MNLVRWSPLGLTPSRDIARMRDDMDRLLDSFFTQTTRPDPVAMFAPPVDIQEGSEEFTVRIDLPGVPQKDVKVQLMGDSLVIRGERKSEQRENDGNVVRSERVYGTFERSFTLSGRVQADRVKATFKDGVLEIRIPKAEEAKVREIRVESE